MENRVLALDLGIKTGWATRPIDNKEGLIFNSVEFKTTSTNGTGQRLRFFEKYLNDLITTYKPAAVVCEIPVRSHFKVTVAQSKMIGIVEKVAYTSNIFAKTINSKTVKKFVTNNGNSKKPEVAKVLEKKFKTDFKNDFEITDALALLLYTEAKFFTLFKKEVANYYGF